ncbi:hydrolase [Ningiella sp. W23]|uniref:hydrolase n=1 Tax=Ningiella sp. W23 TaxID=3023715 RepID=UPI003757CA48
MDETRFGSISEAGFRPPVWASNAHLQTLYPKFVLNAPKIVMRYERINTDDGDFLDLAMHIIDDAQIQHADESRALKPIALLFHGLEGSKDSHYIQHLMYELAANKISCIVMHFRGCSGQVNRRPRAYHSGETGDALLTLKWIKRIYPQSTVVCAGFSLGGNMLLKLLADNPEADIHAAVSVCAPIQLAASSQAINRGFAKRYQAHLLKSMKANLLQKMHMMDMREHVNLNAQQITALDSFYDFDEHVTAPLHGFKDADDYYAKCSALPLLRNIQTPTLMIHAADDPFMDRRVIPKENDLSPQIAYELSETGGHVGFMQSKKDAHYQSPFLPSLYLPARIHSFFQTQLFKDKA